MGGRGECGNTKHSVPDFISPPHPPFKYMLSDTLPKQFQFYFSFNAERECGLDIFLVTQNSIKHCSAVDGKVLSPCWMRSRSNSGP